MALQFSGAELAPIFLKIPPEHIVRLKFVLESYEHLGVLRTLRREDGIVAIFAVKDTLQEVRSVLDSLQKELIAESLDPGASLPPFLHLTAQQLRQLGVMPEGAKLDGDSEESLWLLYDSPS